MSFDDCRSVATTSSGGSEEKKLDSEHQLDSKVLQLIKASKFQKSGAKFPVFGEYQSSFSMGVEF